MHKQDLGTGDLVLGQSNRSTRATSPSSGELLFSSTNCRDRLEQRRLLVEVVQVCKGLAFGHGLPNRYVDCGHQTGGAEVHGHEARGLERSG
jgi:hypothetical protein